MSEIDIRIDRDLCQGARQCSFTAPAVFGHDEDGTAVVTDPYASPVEDLLRAAQLCPNLAITLVVDGEVLHEGI